MRKYHSAFEAWAKNHTFDNNPAGRAQKQLCYHAWCAGTVFNNVAVKGDAELNNIQLNKKIDLMASNIQGQMFSGMEKNERDLEEIKDQLEALRAQVQTLQQNLRDVASRPYLDMTRY